MIAILIMCVIIIIIHDILRGPNFIGMILYYISPEVFTQKLWCVEIVHCSISFLGHIYIYTHREIYIDR